jgi:hypothetical protein
LDEQLKRNQRTERPLTFISETALKHLGQSHPLFIPHPFRSLNSFSSAEYGEKSHTTAQGITPSFGHLIILDPPRYSGDNLGNVVLVEASFDRKVSLVISLLVFPM